MKAAKSDAVSYNAYNNFFYCYVGAPKFGPSDVEMTVLIDKAITVAGLTAWIKDGKGAISTR